MSEPKRTIKAVKQAEKHNRDMANTETRLSDFGVSGEIQTCHLCNAEIPANKTHLKIYESEFSRKTVKRRCMMCCATGKRGPKTISVPAPEKPQAPPPEPKKQSVKGEKTVKGKAVEPQAPAEESGDKKLIGGLLSKFKNKK